MKIIGRIQCWLGWHDWRYGKKPKDSLSIGWTGNWRKCRRCRHKMLHYDFWGWR